MLPHIICGTRSQAPPTTCSILRHHASPCLVGSGQRLATGVCGFVTSSALGLGLRHRSTHGSLQGLPEQSTQKQRNRYRENGPAVGWSQRFPRWTPFGDSLRVTSFGQEYTGSTESV
jgi:hypothetical protein